MSTVISVNVSKSENRKPRKYMCGIVWNHPRFIGDNRVKWLATLMFSVSATFDVFGFSVSGKVTHYNCDGKFF